MQVRLDIEDKSPKVCLVKVCADSVRMHTVSTLGREESTMELINFFAKVGGWHLFSPLMGLESIQVSTVLDIPK